MLSSISEFQKKIWSKWNTRIVILFSLFLQIFLIVSAPSRKRTRGFFVFFVWLAYLLADWAAGYCIGLISNNQEQKSGLSENDYLMAFWGPFLLLHLGGPDTISAFALEDNELWLRHLLGLIFQLSLAAYVFLLTLPRNTLWLPTMLIFVAGLIKYAERTHALYVAAVNNFRKSLLPHPNAASDYSVGMPYQSPGSEVPLIDDDSLELVHEAFIFFNNFQGLIVDTIYTESDRFYNCKFFNSRTSQQALMLIEIELNFIYEVFYTKASVVRQYWFWFWAKFVSLISIMAALLLFIKADRHGFDQLDVRVTYVLLSGALLLDVMALFTRFFTDYTATLSSQIYSHAAPFYRKFQIRLFKYLNKRFLVGFLRLRKPTWSTIKEGPCQGCEKLSTNFLFRRWCGSISGHNLLKYCLHESVPRDPNINLHPSFYFVQAIQRVCFRIVVFVQDFFCQHSGIKDLLDQWRYQSKNPFLKELWVYILDKLREKSGEAGGIDAMQIICSARGERVVQKEELESLKPFVDPNEVAFDQSLLLWHIATTLCYYAEEDTEVKQHDREISMILSDYMLYLLIMQPNMMSAIAGIGQIRFQDTCEEAKRYFKRRISARFHNVSNSRDRGAMLRKACQFLTPEEVEVEVQPIGRLEQVGVEPIDKWDKSKSLLFDACRLARELEKLGDEDKKWVIISSVWVELLSYAACHCRPVGHVQLLSKGGELISFVRLSMVHLGLSPQFQINGEHSRPKIKLLDLPN